MAFRGTGAEQVLRSPRPHRPDGPVALDRQVIDEDDIRTAFASFDPVWHHLLPAEKARALQLLVTTITYNATDDTVEIDLHPGGVRTLAEEKERDAV